MPADLYSSGISVVVDGVDIQVKSKKQEPRPSPKAGSPNPRKSAQFKAGFQDEDDHLPTPQDISASFLDDEPLEERRELEEAIRSRSGRPLESDVRSDDGDSDEEADAGTGVPMALPGFLANFLKGIADRLEVTIKNVTFLVDGELPNDDVNMPGQIGTTLQASLKFLVERVDVEGLTTPAAQPDANDDPTAEKSAKRRIRLCDISASIITESALFNSLERLPNSSPITPRPTSSSPREEPSTPPNQVLNSSVLADRSAAEDSTMDDQSLISEAPILAKSSVEESEHLPDQSVSGSLFASRPHFASSRNLQDDPDRFADASDDDEPTFSTGLGISQRKLGSSVKQSVSSVRSADNDGAEFDFDLPPHSQRHYDHDRASESPTESQLFSDPPDDLLEPQPLIEAGGSRSLLEELPPAAPSALRKSHHDLIANRSQQQAQITQSAEDVSQRSHHHSSIQPSMMRSRSSGSSSDSGEASQDLLESKLFTHEDAESMYMSAMSDFSDGEKAVVAQGNESNETSDFTQPIESHLQQSSPHIAPETNLDATTPRPEVFVNASPNLQKAGAKAVSSEPKTAGPRSFELPSSESRSLSGSTALITKEFFSIDQTSIFVPWATNSTVGKARDRSRSESTDSSSPGPKVPGKSILIDMPGGFSQYSEHKAARRRRLSSPPPKARGRTRSRQRRSSGGESAEDGPANEPLDIELAVGNVRGSLDISAARLLYHMLIQLLDGLVGDKSETRTTPPETTSSSQQRIKLTVEQIFLAFSERLAYSPPANPNESVQTPRQLDNSQIFVLQMNSLESTYSKNSKTTDATARIGKLTFGLPGDPIIAFDSESSMRTSIRDITRPQGSDVSITFHGDVERGPELHLDCLPIKLSVNVPRLDDKLSFFGGLSGVLDLSSSVASASTVMGPSPDRNTDKTVRFDTAAPSSTSSQTLLPIKFNARLSGVLVTVEGKACGVALHTSAVKVAVRDNYAAVQIDRIKISGPFAGSRSSEPPFTGEMENTSLRFQLAPNEDDLDTVVSLITPSRDKYEDDDDILLDTLLRQRKKGSVIKVNVASTHLYLRDLEGIQRFQLLGDELAKLSSVTKYLPEDDRPGILALCSIERLRVEAFINSAIGHVDIDVQRSRLAHVGLPALLALEIGQVLVRRNFEEELVGPVLQFQGTDRLPMIMARQIGDELEPTIKVKLFNLGAEYRVPTIMAAMGLSDGSRTEDLALSMASSIATIRGEPHPTLTRQSTTGTQSTRMSTKALHLDLLVRACGLGLNPAEGAARGIVLLSNAHLTANVSEKEDLDMTLELRKAHLLLVDDVEGLDLSLEPIPRTRASEAESPAQLDLLRQGYQQVASLSSAKVVVTCTDASDGTRLLEVKIGDQLMVMETCADSTQTLISLLNGLKPPMPPSRDVSFQTKVIPVEDLMNDLIKSCSGEAFPNAEDYEADLSLSMEDADQVIEDLPTNLDFVGSLYLPEGALDDDFEVDFTEPSPVQSRGSGSKIKMSHSTSFADIEEAVEFPSDDPLQIIENYLDTFNRRGAARSWNSKLNKYGVIYQSQVTNAPLRVKVELGEFIWNLFDGYDWVKTRAAISKAVDDIQARAEQRRIQRQNSPLDDEDEESEVGDFLFQSIWIAIPANKDARDLRRQINRDIDDQASETTTAMTSTDTRTTTKPPLHRRKSKSLKLERSKRHKISFDVRNMVVDILVMPPNTGETQSSINVRVSDLDIYDHMPTSTWKKFATYMHAAGERQMDKPQIHLELLNVKPTPDLAATELVVKVNVLPLRLHVDQDALDFITRFFEFKDDDAKPESKEGGQPFIQRLEICEVKLKLDYKPKRVDYAGIRSGHTTEFKNFFILDAADITLRHAILYGVPGFDRLNKMLNDIWLPDVQRNQLPTVLAGLGPVRPFVNVGSGFGDLVLVPIREYKKDGRIVRSVWKGAGAFGRRATSELARFGAKVAIGTQTALEGAEGLLSPPTAQQNMGNRRRRSDDSWEDDFSSSPSSRDEPRAVSNYADQPLNVVTGVRTAFYNLERDLTTARDAVIAIGADVRESDSARGVANAVARHGATVVLRPVIATTRAIGTTLLGAGNALDKDSRRKIEDVGSLPFFHEVQLLTYAQKYKSY